jgi:hypothetical protein
MPENLAAAGETARPRLRCAVTTILFVLISFMIVRDILVRRWSSPASPAADVTERSGDMSSRGCAGPRKPRKPR